MPNPPTPEIHPAERRHARRRLRQRRLWTVTVATLLVAPFIAGWVWLLVHPRALLGLGATGVALAVVGWFDPVPHWWERKPSS